MLNTFLFRYYKRSRLYNTCVNLNTINYDKNKCEFLNDNNIEIEGRKNLIKRCIVNIIGNGLAYGEKIFIQTKKSINSAVIIIEDNGPGIPQSEYLNEIGRAHV